MVSSNWVSGGLSAGCAADWVDEQEDATEAALATRFYFRKVVPAGATNFVGAQVSPGPLAANVPASTPLMYGLVVQGSVVELTNPKQTPEAFHAAGLFGRGRRRGAVRRGAPGAARPLHHREHNGQPGVGAPEEQPHGHADLQRHG